MRAKTSLYQYEDFPYQLLNKLYKNRNAFRYQQKKSPFENRDALKNKLPSIKQLRQKRSSQYKIKTQQDIDHKNSRYTLSKNKLLIKQKSPKKPLLIIQENQISNNYPKNNKQQLQSIKFFKNEYFHSKRNSTAIRKPYMENISTNVSTNDKRLLKNIEKTTKLSRHKSNNINRKHQNYQYRSVQRQKSTQKSRINQNRRYEQIPKYQFLYDKDEKELIQDFNNIKIQLRNQSYQLKISSNKKPTFKSIALKDRKYLIKIFSSKNSNYNQQMLKQIPKYLRSKSSYQHD